MNYQDRGLGSDQVRRYPQGAADLKFNPNSGASPRQAMWSCVIAIAIVVILGAVFYGINAELDNAAHPRASSSAVTAAPESTVGNSPSATAATTGQGSSPAAAYPRN
jgi:hypothetical protein